MPKIGKQQPNGPKRRTGGSVIDRIASVAILGDTGMKVNVYGRSGTGKTTFACSFPKPLLIVGAEDGKRSVQNVKGVDYVRLRESEELAAVVDHLKGGKYASAVLDSASSLQDMILKEILGLDELPAQRSWGMASREQYGQCSLKTKESLRALLNLAESSGANVIIIAQERNFNDEGTSEILLPTVGSALTPSVTGWLNPACDYIVQTFIRQKSKVVATKVGDKVVNTIKKLPGVEYCLRTAADPVYTTKFRLPKGTPLPDVIVDPDFAKMAKLSQGG